MTPATNIGVLVTVTTPAAQLLIQLPAKEPRKATEDGPYVWAPATQDGLPGTIFPAWSTTVVVTI